MAGGVAGDGETTPGVVLLSLVQDIVCASAGTITGDFFKKDSTDLVRRIALLSHLFEEIRDLKTPHHSGPLHASTSLPSSSSKLAIAHDFSDLVLALKAAKRLLFVARTFISANTSSDGAAKKIAFQFECVTWKLEKALGNLPFDQFDISEEVQEQVQLVRAQLRRAAKKYGSPPSVTPSVLPQLLDSEISILLSDQWENGVPPEISDSIDDDITMKMDTFCNSDSLINQSKEQRTPSLETMRNISTSDFSQNDANAKGHANSVNKSVDENKKSDANIIPDDFLCPISLELMRDPVIVATGQTYERSYIQRWIDCGNTTCPKTQQKLQNFTLTPNYVLRSLISQWCLKHNIEQPTGLTNGKIKKCDGTYRDVCEEIAAIETLVRKLSGHSVEEQRAAVTELRSLSKRSTDNRILIAEAGAIPALVNLLTSEDVLIQENAVTSILNLSIYENNKGLIMLAGAIPSIVQVLRVGSMEARENAAATLFSLSLADENRIIIGASGAIPALVELLQNGSTRGKKDAATALFNLCIYQGNKGRAVRAGIVSALLKMLTDSNSCMVDEALTIMSVLANHQEAKVAIVKVSTIPVLIDLVRTSLPRNKENAAAILLALCKRDSENLACISRLGAIIPLTELAKSGTERAKRKANSLLEHLRKLQQGQH